MKTLVYKRTHNGDPNEQGVFGCHGCMGSVRSWDFEAAIGVGGQGEEPVDEGIAFKVTWIGIGPHKITVPGDVHPIVMFDHFLYYGPKGDDLRIEAPHLSDLMYVNKARTVMTFNADEQAEVVKLLARASDAPASTALAGESQYAAICKPRPATGC